MHFELLAAVVVAAGVVERDAALPQVRGVGRRESGEGIELGGGLRQATGREVRNGAIEHRLPGRRSRLRPIEVSENRDRCHYEQPHHPDESAHRAL
mgnify:CR=1 FL=1